MILTVLRFVTVIAFCTQVVAGEDEGMLFYVPFDGTVEASVARGSPSAKSVKGKEVYVGGRKGKALACGEKFAECCYYHVKDNIDLAKGSLELWIKPVDWEAADGKKHHVFFETGAFEGARLLLYKPAYSDKIQFIIWPDAETPIGVSAKEPVTKGRWHHLVATWTNGEVAFYVNGVLAEKDARPEVIMPRAVGPTFTVGDKPWGTQRGDGRKTLIDEFSIYDRVLSAGEIAKRYKAGSAVTTSLAASMTEQPPTIDGYMGSGEWDNASCVTGFISNATAAMAERQTQAYVSYDRKKLYIAFSSVVKPGTTLLANTKSHDGPVHRDDAVEIYLAPAPADHGQESVYYHFIGNSAGIFLDGKGTDNRWEGKWDYACTVTREVDAIGAWRNIWTAEVAIPFSELGVAAPGEGETWRVNFCRDWQNPKEYTAWSYAPDFHDPGTFGNLTFLKAGPSLRVFSFGKLSQGKLDLKAEAVNPKDGTATELVGHIEVRAAGTTEAEHTIPIQLKPGDVAPVQFAHELKGQPDSLSFSVTSPDGARIYSQTVLPFGQLDIDEHLARMVLLPFSTGTCQVTLDIGVLPQDLKNPQAVISLIAAESGKTTQTETISNFDGSIGQGSLDIRDLEPGTYRVAISIRESGNEVYNKTLEFTKPVSEWLNSNAGVTDEVLPPWTPLEVDGTTVKCWGREYHLDLGVLPSKIVTRGTQILKEPMYLEVTFADGRSVRVNPAVKTVDRNQTGSKVTITGESKCDTLQFAATGYIEFDGMIYLQVEVTPLSPTKVTGLSLVMPLKAEHTKLKHSKYTKVRKGVATVVQKDGWEWYGSNPYYMWVGDEDVGITWFMETQGPWALSKGAEFMGLSCRGDTMTWNFNFIDSKTTVNDSKTIAFGLEATPVKPLPTQWRSWGLERNGTLVWTKSDLMKHWAYPEAPDLEYATNKFEEKRNYYKKINKRDVYLAPYIGTQMHDAESPEFQYYGAEWEVPGGPRVKQRDKSGTRANVCAGSETYRNFITWKIEKYIQDMDLDGLYFDMVGPWRCVNQHHGCTNSMRILGARDLYKRIYTILRRHNKGKQTFIVQHHHTLCTPVVTFGDAYWMGEPEKLTEHNDYLKLVDLDYFRSFFRCRQFGFVPFWEPPLRTEWVSKCKEYMKQHGLKEWYYVPEFTDGTEQMMAIALLIDVPTVSQFWCDGRIVARIWKILDDYEISTDDSVEFLPYWNNAQYVGASFRQEAPADAEYPQPLVSIYNRRGKCALVTVANLSLKDNDVLVELDIKALGLDPESVRIVDAYYEKPHLIMATANLPKSEMKLDNPYEGEPVVLKDGLLTLRINARKFRLIGLR